MNGNRQEGKSPNHNHHPPPPPNHMHSFSGLHIGLLVELNAVVNVCLSPVASAWRSSRNAIKRALLLITLRCQTAEKQNPLHGNEVERPAALNATRHTKQDTLRDRLGKLRFLFKANMFVKETLGLTRTYLAVMLFTVKNYIPKVRTNCDFEVQAMVRLGLPLSGMWLH